MSKPDRDQIILLICIAGLLIIAGTPTVAGLLLRAMPLAPLVWAGVLDMETATRLAVW